jgi:hypothetical protein
MIARTYLPWLVLGGALWSGTFLAFTWIIDPYGVSPLRVTRHLVNEFKPRRVDIDRALKPYEVWRYHPKTVFLGSSRIQQGIDPAVLDGTPLAAAYNASIPASTVGENAAHLEQYLYLNPELEVVFVELFLSNFIFPDEPRPRKRLADFAGSSIALHLSATAILDAAQTLRINRRGAFEGPQLTKWGQWLPPKIAYTRGSFEGFIDAIMTIHQRIPDLQLQPTVFAALDQIVNLCREKNCRLHLLISPSHPYDDYRWLSLGYWHLIEEWYRRLAEYPGVISFSQYHAPLEEPIKERMEYWYDPIHFSPKMGNLMLRSFVGSKDPDIPENMLVPVNRESVEHAIAARRQGLERWMRKNPEFVAEFDAAKFATRNDEASRRWAIDNPKLASQRTATERDRETSRSSTDRVAESLESLSEIERLLKSRFPGHQVTEFKNITKDLLSANAVPKDMIRVGRLANAWKGPFNVQIFPPNAWHAGVGATYNFVFGGVPRSGCSLLIEALSRRPGLRPFRINLEPSKKVYESFPIVGDEGCQDGENSIGYTVLAG